MKREPILLVEDNPANSRLVRILLEREGHTVRTASDAEEALQVLETFAPKLILMDIQLPGMDGLTLTRKLKTDPRTRETPIVVMSAYAMKGDKARALTAGCQGYITKPIDTRHFAADVLSYISIASAQSGAGSESSTRPANPDPVFEQFRAEYVKGLDDYLRRLQAVTNDLAEGCTRQRNAAFARIAHNLAGTGSTYGFSTITESARALERTIAEQKSDAEILSAVRNLDSACRHAAITFDTAATPR